MKATATTIEALLQASIHSDLLEEEAQEYLEDRQVPLRSHSRASILSQAFQLGWRPY